jgi:alcohol dehydrogenase (cytochrome c)
MKELKRGRVVLTLAGALMASTMAVPAFAQVTQERLENTDAEPQNWMLPGGDYAGRSYSSLSQINMGNVSSLRMIANIPIATALQDTTSQNLEGRPIVVDGMMYYNDAWGVMYGVDISDPHNPVIRWITDPAMDREAGEVLINRAGAVYGDRYLTNLTDGRVVAVDVNTGELVIDEQIARTEADWEYDAGEGFTAPPLPVDGMLLVGQSKGDWGTRGFLAAVSTDTGEELWRTYTVPGPGEFGHETWADPEGTAWHTGGGSLWQVGAYDPATRLTIWGTANPVPMFDPEFRPGDNLFTNSAIAFNVDDGSINWYFQYTPNESWDYDEIGIHMLVDVDVDGEERLAVVHYARNGYYYRLDRTNGEFLSANQWVDTINWTDGIDEKTGLPVEYDPNLLLQTYRPETRGLRDTLPTFDFCPTMLGGVRWQPTAYDPATRTHYVAGMDGCSNVTIAPEDPVEGGGNPNGVGAVWLGGGDIATRGVTQDEANGLMVGINVDTGEIVAEASMRYQSQSGLVATGGGLLFHGGYDGRITAHDSATLEEVWGYNLGIRIKAAPISFAVNGNQYIAVIAGAAGGGGGYAELANLQTGAMVFIFGLE